MNKNVYTLTQANVARELGVASFEGAVRLSDDGRAAMIKNARKAMKIKCHSDVRDMPSGNPYVMLGRKVNAEGKRVK